MNKKSIKAIEKILDKYSDLYSYSVSNYGKMEKVVDEDKKILLLEAFSELISLIEKSLKK